MANAGTVVTFYSYKGGVGRTFTLANVAAILGTWGYRVLCIDWDLDAPGLAYYFETEPRLGLVELIRDFANRKQPDPRRYVTALQRPNLRGEVAMLAAGARDDGYISRARALDWGRLYREVDLGRFLEECRAQWVAEYDFVLVDSRTGISDLGGICTAQLPDILVLLFTANDQSLRGVIDVARRAELARDGLPYDRGRLAMLPIPSRFDAREEYKQAEFWRSRFVQELEFMCDSWIVKDIPMTSVLGHVTVPYVSYWSFGERLAAIHESKPSPHDISYAFQAISAMICHRLARTDLLAENRDSYISAAARAGLGVQSGRRYLYDVFVDYARPDHSLADALVTRLRSKGLRVWWSEEGRRGKDWSGAERDAVTRSRHIVPLLGADAKGLSRAVELFDRQSIDDEENRLIVPVLAPGFDRRSLPHRLANRTALYLTDDSDVEIAASKIAQAVSMASATTEDLSPASAATETRRLLLGMQSWQLDAARWDLADRIVSIMDDAARSRNIDLLRRCSIDLEAIEPIRSAVGIEHFRDVHGIPSDLRAHTRELIALLDRFATPPSA
jgi:MinD-like ATPase involved in chromosome partitioning or flagellar assembly